MLTFFWNGKVVTSSVGAAGLVDGGWMWGLLRLRSDLPNCRVEMTSRAEQSGQMRSDLYR